jgi:hypothetical protein
LLEVYWTMLIGWGRANRGEMESVYPEQPKQ